MTDRELLDRKGHEVNDDLPTLPEPVAWMIRNLVDTEVQPWPTRPDSEAYALASVHQGYECSPLYTADQLRAAVLAERGRCAKECDKIGERHRKMNDSRPPELMTSGENAAYECADAIRKDAP